MFDMLLDKALENFFSGNVKEAKGGFIACLTLKPDDKLALIGYTISDTSYRNLKNATRLMRYSVVANDTELDKVLQYLYGDETKNSNDPESESWLPAISSTMSEIFKNDLELAVKLNHDFPEAEMFLGKIYRRLGEYGNAVEHLQKSLMLNPFELEAIKEIEHLFVNYDKLAKRS